MTALALSVYLVISHDKNTTYPHESWRWCFCPQWPLFRLEPMPTAHTPFQHRMYIQLRPPLYTGPGALGVWLLTAPTTPNLLPHYITRYAITLPWSTLTGTNVYTDWRSLMVMRYVLISGFSGPPMARCVLAWLSLDSPGSGLGPGEVQLTRCSTCGS